MCNVCRSSLLTYMFVWIKESTLETSPLFRSGERLSGVVEFGPRDGPKPGSLLSTGFGS